MLQYYYFLINYHAKHVQLVLNSLQLSCLMIIQAVVSLLFGDDDLDHVQ
ncbi:MAG: hypothetical protein K8R63_02725 [Bacteroidales bacterium]|nr:hypothetical protein [Bacteroidales bacterium]